MVFPRRFLAVFFAICGLAPSVVFAQIANDPFVSDQWYLSKIQALEAWKVTTGSPNVTVAVIDTGVDITHEDLKDNIWTNEREIPSNGIDDDRNGFIDDIHGWNFVHETNDVGAHRVGDETERSIAHGTLVASLIGARGGNGIGMAGIAWHVRVMPLVALDAMGTGSTDAVSRAIHYAVDHGAQIINLSMEGPLIDDALIRAISYADSHHALVVTAAGNAEEWAGNDLDILPVYPACMETNRSSLIAVSGTDRDDRKAPYANYGSCIDIVAPSVGILAAEPVLPDDEVFSFGYSEGWGGTSLATPIVSGAAALLKSAHPDWLPPRLKSQLVQTADPIAVSDEAYRGKTGSGRLNIGSALTEEILPTSFSIHATQPGRPTVVSIVTPSSTKTIYPFGEEDVRGAYAAIGDMDENGEPEIAVVSASGHSVDFVLYASDGSEYARLVLSDELVDGALVTAVSGGYVVADAEGGTAWGIDATRTIRTFYPYERHYANGLDLLTVQRAAAFAPRHGGGRLVISNVRGEQLVSAFPFGTEPDGRWSLARMDASDGSFIVFSGPTGSKRVSVEAMGQLGWEPVSFDQLSASRITLSSGMRTQDPFVQIYGNWTRVR